jgi:hypothetical protein
MSSDKIMTIAIAQADVPNLIGNVYTKEAISKMYEKTKEAIDKGFFGGVLISEGSDHQIGKVIDLSRVTHHVTNVDIIDNFLVADVSFIETKEGELAKNLVLTATGVLRPTILGSLDSITREIDIDNVISFDVIQYHEDFRVDITWKTVR